MSLKIIKYLTSALFVLLDLLTDSEQLEQTLKWNMMSIKFITIEKEFKNARTGTLPGPSMLDIFSKQTRKM